MYGGGAAHPNLLLVLLLFSLYGIISACVLGRRHFSGRIAALLWHAVLIAYVLWTYNQRVRRPAYSSSGLDSPAHPAYGQVFLWWLYALAVIYLAISAILQWRENRNKTDAGYNAGDTQQNSIKCPRRIRKLP